MSLSVEPVEKVTKQILGQDAEKNDLIECDTISDLMLGRGQETPENHPLIVLRGFFYRLVSQTRIDNKIYICSDIIARVYLREIEFLP